VIFDLDGTLFDHPAAAGRAIRAWLGSLGVHEADHPGLASAWLEVEERHFAAVGSSEQSFQEIRRRRLRDFLPLFGHPVVESQLDDVFACYLRLYEASWRPYPEALDALTALRAAGWATAVLTNGDQQQQEAKLAATGLEALCGPVFASRALGVGKPDRRAYEAVLNGCGAQAEESVMVGDNYELDVLAARAAGLRGIHLDRTGTHPTPDDQRIRSLDEAMALLGRAPAGQRVSRSGAGR
jgi:putative hydrolase of the HAD superfamily